MPSTLYESVKKSVIEFTQIKKKNEKQEDKLVFRWKLITLGLSILLIVLIGVFSQLLKALNQLPQAKVDQTYILPLIQKINSNSISTISQIQNLITGISTSMSESNLQYQWNRVQQLYSFAFNNNAIDIEKVTASINGKSNLIFIFYSSDAPTSSFGLFSLKSFSSEAHSDDQSHSTIFNLKVQKIHNYISSACSLYKKTSSSLTLFNMIQIKADGAVSIGVIDDKVDCFATNKSNAYKQIGQLTDVIFTVEATKTIKINNLQIYSLYLDQSL